jgi:hypothetical protein
MRNVGHWQDQLHGRVLFGGDPAELLHGSLLFDLVLFLQATLSFFLAEKTTRRPIMPTVESRYFLRFTGHPRQEGIDEDGFVGFHPMGESRL